MPKVWQIVLQLALLPVIQKHKLYVIYIYKNKIAENLKYVFEQFPRLEERRKQLAGTLSGGEQQMLAMGRALLSNPDLIVLDEPSMGLSPLLVSEIFDIIKTLRNLFHCFTKEFQI